MCSWLCSPLRTRLCVCVCVFSLDSQISSFSACSMAKDEIVGISLYTSMAEMLSEGLLICNVSMVLFSVEAMHNGERVPRLQC